MSVSDYDIEEPLYMDHQRDRWERHHERGMSEAKVAIADIVDTLERVVTLLNEINEVEFLNPRPDGADRDEWECGIIMSSVDDIESTIQNLREDFEVEE